MTSRRLSRVTIQKILCIFDLLSAFLAVYFSLLIRNLVFPSFEYWWKHVVYFLPFFFFAICTLYLEGGYVVTKPIKRRILVVKLCFVGCFGWLLGFVFFYFSISAINFPKTILLLFWFFFCTFIFCARMILNHIIFSRHQIPVVFLGNSISYGSLSNDLLNNKMYGYKPILLYQGIQDRDALLQIIEKENKGGILFIYKFSSNLLEDLSDLLKQLIADGNQFIEYSEFYEYIERKIPPEDIGESWFLSNINLNSKHVYVVIKRILDLLFALIGLILTICLWPLIAIVIHLDSTGSVFFLQKREGKNRSIFNLIKFRSMKTTNNDGSVTVKNDIRITKVGRILRATRLDELPQLLNVLKGDMSLIGPRPERPELAVDLEKEVPWYKQRLLVRPGITGWDQVCGEYHSPSKEDTYKKLQNDLYYIKNCSISLDISIAFKTFGTVFRREGQ